MPARIKLEFVKRHSWVNPGYFNVYHSEGSHLQYPLECISGNEQLWNHSWERAGFGHGRFGYGSFGWGQGGVVNGGFGFGRFGSGEFGYYNEVAQWITPKEYSDGLHTFGVDLFSEYGLEGISIARVSILIISPPEPAHQILFKQMVGGVLELRYC